MNRSFKPLARATVAFAAVALLSAGAANAAKDAPTADNMADMPMAGAMSMGAPMQQMQAMRPMMMAMMNSGGGVSGMNKGAGMNMAQCPGMQGPAERAPGGKAENNAPAATQ